MRVLAACSLGGAGHFRPLVPFLDQARRSGGETLVVGPPALAGMVGAAGHPFLPGGEPPEEQVRPIREQLPVVPPDVASVLGNRELFGRLATTAMLPAAERAVRDWRPDVILRDPCEYASAVAAARLGVPAAQVAIGPAAVEWASIGVAAPALEAHRAGLTGELRRSPYLTRFPAALDAVTRLDARVLVTTGHGFDASRLRDVPANVHVEAWVDQAGILGEAAVVVCHGGSGTAYGALAVGVPLVVVPVFADQFANAAEVVQAGAGIEVRTSQDSRERRRPVGRDDAPLIRQAIDTVLADGSYRNAAQAVAADMAAAPAIAALLASPPWAGRGLVSGQTSRWRPA